MVWRDIYVARDATHTPRKEVIQPLLPERLPCYDLAPIANLALGGQILAVSGTDFGHC